MADHTVAHLDEITWERLAMGELSPDDRDRCFDHITACADCTRTWRGLQLLKAEAETRGLIAAAPIARPWWRAQLVPLAVAASVVLAVAAFFVTLRTDIDPGTVRGSGALAAIDGMMSSYDANGVPLFVWTPVAGATRYRLEIFTEDGRPVWSGDVSASPASWPAGVTRANGRYRWRVEAMSADSPTARSRLMPLDVTR